MSVQSKTGSIKKGDWVFATNKHGASICGQANNSVEPIGYSALEIVIDVDLSVTINVNFWDVAVSHSNFITIA